MPKDTPTYVLNFLAYSGLTDKERERVAACNDLGISEDDVRKLMKSKPGRYACLAALLSSC